MTAISSSTTSSTSTSSTSSTSTSSSSTRTITTTSTPLPLLIDRAEFSQGFSRLLITFNQRDTTAGSDPDCATIFTADTMALLGSSPSCTWKATHRSLDVALGQQPTVQPGSLLETLPGALAPERFGSLTATVETGEAVVQPHAVVQASPLILQACGRVLVSAVASTGSAGRGFTVVWSLGPQSTVPLAQQLQATVSAATELSFEIPTLEFFAAVETTKATMGSSFYSTDIKLEFVVEITNWLGVSDQASAVVQLEKSDVPILIVNPTSPFHRQIFNSEEVKFSVETRHADTSCGTQTAVETQNIVVNWEYRDESGAWMDFANSALIDVDRRPGALCFDPFSFAANSTHHFRVTAGYANSKATQYNFSLSVAAAPPVVRLVAPSSVSTECNFGLNASSSFDPSLPLGTFADLAYRWSCVDQAGGDCGLPGSTGAQLDITGNQLDAGMYNFSVQVSRGANVAEALWQLQVSSGNRSVPVAFAMPFSSGEAVSTQVGLRGAVRAYVQTSTGCFVPDGWAWSFALAEESGSFLSFLKTSSVVDADGLTLSSSDFPGSALIPGRRYVYWMLQMETQEEMDLLQSQLPESLTEAVARGARVVESPPFLADGPPSGGLVQISPPHGIALTTSFSGKTTGWYDEDVDSLSFEYYLLPLRQNITLSVGDGGSLAIDGTFVPPMVDYTNSTSPNYWAKLGGSVGGTFLANVTDPSAALWDLQIAAGSYVMAVVARDRLGAVSAAYAPGPLVELPAGGVTADMALRFLDLALARSDEFPILHTLDSIASVDVITNNSAELVAVIEKQTEAVGAAADVMGPSMESLITFGDVMTRVLPTTTASAEVTATSSAALTAVTEQVSTAVETALDVSLSFQGVNPAAGLSLLRATSAVAESFQSVNSSTVEREAQTAKLQTLFSKLGTALLLQLADGQTTEIASVASDGTGTELSVFKELASTAAEFGITSLDTQIPGSALGRRLQSECNSLAVQTMTFLRSNPFSYLFESDLGLNRYVHPNATVSSLEIKRCDTLLERSNLDPPITMKLPLNPAVGSPPDGYSFEPACVRLDKQEGLSQAWTSASVTWLLPSSIEATSIECFSTESGGVFAGIFLPVLLPQTSTTTQTSQTTARGQNFAAFPSPQDEGAEGGFLAGSILAGFSLVTVCGIIMWQVYQGNVSVARPDLSWMGKPCFRQTAPLKPETEMKPDVKPKQAWAETEEVVLQKQKQRDAEENFWSWVTDLTQSSPSRSLGQPGPRVMTPGVRGPPLPPLPPLPFAVWQQSDKEEYFNNFAEELRQSAPPPPPKRPALGSVPKPPPLPVERPMSPFPPYVNAYRIEVRVHQDFLDWANDFPLVPVAEEDASPPPLPPPLPPKAWAAVDDSDDVGYPSPIALPNPRLWQQQAASAASKARSVAKAALPLAMPSMPSSPPPISASPAKASAASPVSPLPPTVKAGSMLSMSLPGQQPLHPPVPKGAPSRASGARTPRGMMESDRNESPPTPRE
ncbi:unnamed protein product [Durusdinium trenchii]|uniref:PKD/REJ-like domain-containing protein n=2 Tax=Durusdinium trenchii TaxID=1381693 RepID=A0ABP0MHS4_9DINO